MEYRNIEKRKLNSEVVEILRMGRIGNEFVGIELDVPVRKRRGEGFFWGGGGGLYSIDNEIFHNYVFFLPLLDKFIEKEEDINCI